MIQLNHKKDEEIFELAERLIAEIEAQRKEGNQNNPEKNLDEEKKNLRARNSRNIELKY